MRGCGAGFGSRPGICCWWPCSESLVDARACGIWSATPSEKASPMPFATTSCLPRRWTWRCGGHHRIPRSATSSSGWKWQPCAPIRDWTIVQIPGGAADLDQLVCDGKTLRGPIEPTSSGGSAFIATSRCTPPPSVWPSARPATPPEKNTSGRCCGSCTAS